MAFGVILMGSDRNWHIIFMIFVSLSLSTDIHGLSSHDPEFLESFIHNFANTTLSRQRTGTLYKVSLPTNFSGIEASVVRLRSGSFWAKGANFTSFNIPPWVIPVPYTKRIALVYENWGNWSSYYFNVPNYTLVSPVVGLMAYDAPNSSALGDKKLKLSVRGDAIAISFPHISLEDTIVAFKCVKFGADGSVEFGNMTKPNVCLTKGLGHFSVAIPSSRPKKEERLWKWWVLGFGVGFIGLVSLVLVGVVIVKAVKRKKYREMQKESDKGVALDTIWTGSSRMPSASMIRTQPIFDLDYNP